MTRLLIIIDIQNDYFPGGALPLVAPEAAASAAARVLDAFRASREPLVHVQHVWDAPDATFMRPGTPGVDIHFTVAPVEGEQVITKSEPNAFLGTPLADVIAASGADQVVVAGMMTSMCIDATVRAAAEAGHAVTLVADACAAPDLEHGGTSVPGHLVHTAFIAALADGYAEVVDASEVVASLTGG